MLWSDIYIRQRETPLCLPRRYTQRLAFLLPPLPFQAPLPPEAQCRNVFFNLRGL